MYDKTIEGGGVDHRPYTWERIEEYTTNLNLTKYQLGTVDLEEYWSGIFSVLDMNGDCFWFKKDRLLLQYTKRSDTMQEIKFLVDGKNIFSPTEARALIKPINSWYLGARSRGDSGYELKLTDHVLGLYQGQRLRIIKGQTLVYEPADYQIKKPEKIYIREDVADAAGPPSAQQCPKRDPGNFHEYAVWYRFKEKGYQSCRYCNNLYGLKWGVWHKLHHRPWHIASDIKLGYGHELFMNSLPGAEIYYDQFHNKFHTPQERKENSMLLYTKEHMTDEFIPSYPATTKELEDANKN